jgi:hypothetical protein
MNDTEVEALGRELKDRAFASIGVMVAGVGAAAIHFAGAFLVLFVGWIPLLVWVLRGIDPFFLAV